MKQVASKHISQIIISVFTWRHVSLLLRGRVAVIFMVFVFEHNGVMSAAFLFVRDIVKYLSRLNYISMCQQVKQNAELTFLNSKHCLSVSSKSKLKYVRSFFIMCNVLHGSHGVVSAIMKVVMSVSEYSCITRPKSFLGAIGVGRYCKVKGAALLY
jgi:hypothetical protein